MRSLLLVGGGHAHLQVLRAFAQQPLPAAEVVLVTPQPQLLYSGMLPGLVAGHYRLEDCAVPLAPLAAQAKVTLLEARLTALDAAARRVTLSDGSVLGYDLLSLDTGAEIDATAIPGAAEHALRVRPFEDFVAGWERLCARAAEREIGIAVVGGGAAGVELAMAMAWRLGSRARVSLITGGTLLPGHAGGVRRRALRCLKRQRVTVLDDRCAVVDADQVVLAGGPRLACDATLLAPGPSAPAWLRGSGLVLDAAGFVATGPTLQSESHPNVFAAGDVASRRDAPRPRSGVYAVRAGAPLALNLRRAMAGGELQTHRPQRFALNLLACGERYAIASWGPWSAEGRWLWRGKDRIDRGFIARHGGRPFT